MQTPEEDFPYASDDPCLAPVKAESAALCLTSQQLNDLKATLRLAVGSALNGSEAYLQRLRRLQAMQEPINPENIVINENDTHWDSLRYLLLGILFETPDVIQRGLVTTGRVSAKVYGLFSRILSPVANSWVLSPVKDRVNNAAGRGEKVLDGLMMKGRLEEQNSRRLLEQKNLDDLVNEFLEYVVQKTEIMEIVQEEGFDVAGDVVNEFREQSAAVDTTLENKLRSIFKKRRPPQSDSSPNNKVEGG